MKRNFRTSIFIILTILLSGGIVYSQTISWQLTTMKLRNNRSIAVASNGDIWTVASDEVYSYSGEVYLSTDNGDTWVIKNNGLSGKVYSIAINPANGYIFVAKCNDKWDGGLFRSSNRGETWVNVTNDMDDINGTNFNIFITVSGAIYLVIKGKIYYSSNNGGTWIRKKNNGLPYEATLLALGKDGTLYAKGKDGRGIYRSTNRGDNWLTPSSKVKDVIFHSITFSEDGSIFAATFEGILKSTDKGVTWIKVGNKPASQIIYNLVTKDIFLYAHWTSEVYMSTNLGASWEFERKIGDFRFVVCNPNTGQIYLVTSDGVYRSKNYPEQRGNN